MSGGVRVGEGLFGSIPSQIKAMDDEWGARSSSGSRAPKKGLDAVEENIQRISTNLSRMEVSNTNFILASLRPNPATVVGTMC